MNKTEYLIARVGRMKFGVYCRDVENVFTGQVNLVKLFYQDSMFRGLITINGKLMQVLDLRKRIGLTSNSSVELTLVTFNIGADTVIAVVVDEIIGLQRVLTSCIHKNDDFYEHRLKNIGLLFPMVANVPCLNNPETNELIHLIDSTYLNKTEPIVEESGELELF